MIKLTKTELTVLACILEESKQSILALLKTECTINEKVTSGTTIEAINNIAKKLNTPDVRQEYKDIMEN